MLHNAGVSLGRLDNLPFASGHVSEHDVLQIPPAASGGQLEGRCEEVLPASAVENDVVQGALQDPQHMTNYGIADYPELPGMSEVFTRGASSSCTDSLLRHQYLTVPYTYSDVGPGQGVPEREEVIFPVCTNLPFLNIS